MLVYFQVQDRQLRNFLNGVMPRLPFSSSAGETPPGITDTLIFYDPLVTTTRPGHILPAFLASLIEAGKKEEAEKALIAFILESFVNATLEHDSEMEMLTIEEEEHRRRLKDIAARLRRLKEMAEHFVSATAALKEWKAEAPPGVAHPAELEVSETESAVVAEATEDSSLYAQLAARVRAIMEKHGGALDAHSFDDSFRLAFDLGLSPEAGSRAVSAHLEEFRQAGTQSFYLSEYLNRKFSELYQFQKIRETEEALNAIRAAVSDIKTRLARLQQKRLEVLYSAGLNMATELDREIQAHYQYFLLDNKRRMQSLTVEEKKQFGLLEEELQKLRQNIDSRLYVRFSSSPEFLTTLNRLSQAIVQSLQELNRAQEDEPSKQALLASLNEAYHGASPRERGLKMEEQVKRLKQFAKLLSGRARNRPFAAVTPPPAPVTKAQVREVMDKIQALDTTIFPEKFLRRRGPPGLLLIPCFGSGLYDWQDCLLVVSLYPENLQSAVLASLAEFRMDADDSKELFNSYGNDIKRNRGLGFVRLKEMFIADYGAWIQKEAAGYRVMEKDIKSWFERKIPLAKPGGKS